MAKATEQVIEIKPVELSTVTVRVRGTSPLIVHKWSAKAKKMMLDAQTGETKTKTREKKNPVADFIGSAYWLTEEPTEGTEKAFIDAVKAGARWGFPAAAFKIGACMAASRNELGIKTTVLRGAFFIEGEGADQCVEIQGCIPTMREDIVRVGGMTKTADLRYRAQFDNWYADLKIMFNKNGPVSLEQIVNLINLAGMCCGVGEWRPEKDGSFGMYTVEAMS